MQSLKTDREVPFYVQAALTAVGLVSMLAIVYWGKFLFMPLVLAFLSAIFLYPLAKFLERKHFPKMLAAALSVFVFFLFLCLVLYFFSIQVSQFFRALPGVKTQVDQVIQRMQSWAAQTYHVQAAGNENYVNSLFTRAFSYAGDTITVFSEGMIILALFLFFTFYILYYRKLLEAFAFSIFRREMRSRLSGITPELRKLINGYVRGLLTEMGIISVAGFGLLVIFGIKYALVMAVFAGILNLIPYIGIYTATAINALLTLATGNSSGAIEVVGVFIFIHIIDSNVILPRIVGRSVKMNPFVTLIAVVAGNLVWGIPGMFLSIPVVGIFRVLSEKIKDLQPWAILISDEQNPVPPEQPGPKKS